MEPKQFLFFSPGAHPTYIPLGLASLAGYARLYAPEAPLEVVDLNIRFWQQVMARNADSALVQGFFRGHVGDFYNPTLYSLYRGQLDLYYRHIKGVEQALKDSWPGGEPVPVPELDALLEMPELETANRPRIAFSVMYPGQLLFALYLSRRLKQLHPGAEVVLGGAAMSALDVSELRRGAFWIDGVFEGEGEVPFAAWLKGQPVPQKHPVLSLDCLPDPDYSFANLADYLSPEPVLPVVFSRGCQWKRCRFCCHNASFRGYRAATCDEFAKRLGRLQLRYGTRFFYLADQYVSAEDLRGISQAILDEGLDVRFHVMGRPGSEYTQEILELARKAGCRWISWGVESFSARLLEICDKGTTPAEIARVLEQSSQAGISNLAMMIFGLPGNSEEFLQETLDWATHLHPAVDAFTSSQFQLFGGTPFFRSRSRYGLEVVEQEVLLQLGPQPVHSRRYAYRLSEGGTRLTREIDVWERWKLFTRGGPSFYETLLCEHYLLHCTRARDSRQTPLAPQFPPRVAA